MSYGLLCLSPAWQGAGSHRAWAHGTALIAKTPVERLLMRLTIKGSACRVNGT